MKKKIALGIVAVTIIAGAFVYANSGTKADKGICPNTATCICK